jgi:hypothetical protein
MRRLFWLSLLAGVSALPALAEDPIDHTKRTPVAMPPGARPPEFTDIAEWINSPPLTMAKLKGKVLVVHFMAYG